MLIPAPSKRPFACQKKSIARWGRWCARRPSSRPRTKSPARTQPKPTAPKSWWVRTLEGPSRHLVGTRGRVRDSATALAFGKLRNAATPSTPSDWCAGATAGARLKGAGFIIAVEDEPVRIFPWLWESDVWPVHCGRWSGSAPPTKRLLSIRTATRQSSVGKHNEIVINLATARRLDDDGYPLPHTANRPVYRYRDGRRPGQPPAGLLPRVDGRPPSRLERHYRLLLRGVHPSRLSQLPGRGWFAQPDLHSCLCPIRGGGPRGGRLARLLHGYLRDGSRPGR